MVLFYLQVLTIEKIFKCLPLFAFAVLGMGSRESLIYNLYCVLGKHSIIEALPSPKDLVLSLRDDVFKASLVYMEFQASHGYIVGSNYRGSLAHDLLGRFPPLLKSYL